jgi:WD40 repeat protein
VEIVKEVTGSKLCQEEDDEAMELVFGRPIPRPPVALPVQPGRTVLSLPENVNPDTIKRIPPVGNHDQGDDEQKGEDEARDDGKEDDDHDSANDDNSTLFGNADDHNSIDGGSQDGIDRTDVPRRESNVVHGYGGKKNKKRVDDGVKECPEDDIDDVILGGGMPINCADYRLYRTIKAQTMQPLTSFGITGIIPLRRTGKKKGAEAEAENMSFITAGSTDKMVRVWIPEDIHWSVAKEWKAHRNRVFSMTILSNGNLATGGSDKTIQIWSHKSWMWTNRGFIPSAHTGAIWCLCGMRNMLMISGGSTNDPTVKVWNMKRWSCLRTLTGHRDGISAAVELPNGTVATGGGNNDRTIRIWDIITGECKQTLKGNGQAVTGLAVLANGVLVSSGGDMTVRLWNTTKGTLIRVLRGHTAWINCVCVMGDGVTIASGASDKTIRIWNTTVREKKTKRIASAWGDEEEDVQSVHSLHSANSDGSHTKAPKVVVPTTVCTAVLEGHTNWVSALATLGDGTTLISGGFDDTLRIWNAPKF